jgi:hypothetical protein
VFDWQREYVGSLRETKGEDAARNLVEDQLYYPRAVLPLLLAGRKLPPRPPVTLGECKRRYRRSVSVSTGGSPAYSAG